MSDAGAETRQGLIGQVAHWIATRARASAEMACLARGDLGGMARDLGVSESDLRDVLPHGADNTRLMEAMMLARGLDADQAARLSAAVMRDLELTCTRCGAVARCRRELAAGTAAAHCHEFCGNADTLDALLEEAAKA